MTLGAAFHLQMSMLLAAKDQHEQYISLGIFNKFRNMTWEKLYVICHVFYLVNWDQADNVRFLEGKWWIHIKIPGSKLNSHLTQKIMTRQKVNYQQLSYNDNHKPNLQTDVCLSHVSLYEHMQIYRKSKCEYFLIKRTCNKY